MKGHRGSSARALTLVVVAAAASMLLMGTANAGPTKLPPNTSGDNRATYVAGNIHDDTCTNGTSPIALNVTISGNTYITINTPPAGAFIVYVKGGPAYNVYSFPAGTQGPILNLHPPVNNGGNIAAISHWFACGGAQPTTANVYVGYADAGPEGHPLPTTPLATLFGGIWQGGGASVNFVGAGGGCDDVPAFAPVCGYDAGVVRIDNPTGSVLTITSVLVHIGGNDYHPWGSGPFSVPANGSLVLTQSHDWNFDTSDDSNNVDFKPPTSCGSTTSSVLPTIDIVVNGGSTQTVTDSHQVLLTHGQDLLDCSGVNESLPYSLAGTINLS